MSGMSPLMMMGGLSPESMAGMGPQQVQGMLQMAALQGMMAPPGAGGFANGGRRIRRGVGDGDLGTDDIRQARASRDGDLGGR